MADTSSPKPSVDELKKHVMKVFKDATKDFEDKKVRKMFDPVQDYDTLNTYCIQIFDILASNTLAEEAKELFKPRIESAELVLPDVAIYTVVIWACAMAHRPKAALEVYHRMVAAGVAPTSCTYTILIPSIATNSVSDASFVGYAKKYFLEMLDKGMKPHSAAYVTVLDAIACRESVEQFREFLEQIQAKGFTPESDVHHFKEGHLPEAVRALKVYDDLKKKSTDKEMRKLFRKWPTGRGSIDKELMEMVGALISDGYGEEANALCKLNFEIGLCPVVLIYTRFIQAFLKLGKTKGALETYQCMIASGDAPNSYTYTVLIKGLAADPSFIGDAKKCLIEMMEKGMRPNAATYTSVIESFAKLEDKTSEEECKDLVEVMMKNGFVPNAKAMMELLKGRSPHLIRRVIDIVLSKLKG